jgi:rRNA maturation endonuclease Nob1
MIYLFCGILSGAILGAICIPLFRKDESLESAIIEETEWDLLQRKKEVVLGNIQDLDFEYKCGKLSDEDYQKIRGEMSAEAAIVFQDIESIESTADLDALIRREITARKSKSKSAAPTIDCPTCKAVNPPSNKFCAECGAKLKP